jgi:NET1-associated nuclear protein 1 (U3 small nucleolar RNA-associated protein 17)
MRVSLQHVEASTKSTFLKSAEISIVGKTRFTTGLAISSNGDWLVATAGHKVYVAKTSSLAAGFTKYVSPERLTCLAFHPSQELFATGDDKGVIRMWYCLNDGLAVNVKGVEKKTQTSSMHWHAHAVSALAFTPNGAYLLSGGEEAVLVIWQLHTGRKEFVPRVGSPINTVSVARSKTGEEEYLLGLADATYVFVNSGNLRVSRSYSRVKIGVSSCLLCILDLFMYLATRSQCTRKRPLLIGSHTFGRSYSIIHDPPTVFSSFFTPNLLSFNINTGVRTGGLTLQSYI